MAPDKPLAGIKIVELTTALSGPVAATVLSEQGASTVKVESPGTGDPLRHLGTASAGVAAVFATCNRGKRDLAVDLKTAEGVEIVRKLALDADVLISNYRPGVLGRLGLGSEALRKANPRLIYIAINGFGIEGPLAPAPAYDHVVQAFSGICEMQGTTGSFEPIKTLVVDMVTAYLASQAVTAALFQRTRTGVGQHIDLSMLDAAVHFFWPVGMMDHTYLGEDVKRRPSLKPTFRTFRTKDGSVVMAPLTDAQWHGLFRATGHEEMIEDPRYGNIVGRASHLDVLLDTFSEAFVEMTNDEVESLLLKLDIPGTACLTGEQMCAHPQVRAVDVVQTQAHPVLGPLRLSAHPARFGSKRMDPASPVGLVGEATRDVLADLGYTSEQIDDLVRRKVAFPPG